MRVIGDTPYDLVGRHHHIEAVERLIRFSGAEAGLHVERHLKEFLQFGRLEFVDFIHYDAVKVRRNVLGLLELDQPSVSGNKPSGGTNQNLFTLLSAL